MKIKYSEYQEKLGELIERKASFDIVDVGFKEFLIVSSDIEKYLESKYLKCRVLTKNRVASALSGVFNKNYGIFSLAAIVAHNIFTWNPDYEIIRDIANHRVEVVYKKR
ncbi:hypothetical protein [Mannheimia indoligenes]|uniref:hypothetical protein n=1 Tax=Mannheimia indoligenes TaxID=3103145 RepID=UPI002FE64169